MDNKDFLEKLKFGVGDGNLQYYIYNWKCPQMNPDKVNILENFNRKHFHFARRWRYYFNKQSIKIEQTSKKDSS